MPQPRDILSSFNNVRKENYGARFYRADLHFHTPASADARGKNRYNFNPYKIKCPVKKKDIEAYNQKVREMQEDTRKKSRQIAEKIVDKFIEKNISIVAITDHNGIGTIWPDYEAKKSYMHLAAPTWYEMIDDEAKKKSEEAGEVVLTILPGVEISTAGIHVLAIFPPQQPRRKVHFMICDLLNEAGFAIDDFGEVPEVGKLGVYKAIDLICEKGGFPILAHIDGSDKAWLRKLKLHKLSSAEMKHVLENKNLSAVEIVDPSKLKKKRKKEKVSIKGWIDSFRKDVGLAPLAYFQGADAHDLKTIGKRFSYVKMTEPSFSGLEHSIEVPSSRLRISDVAEDKVEGFAIYGVELQNKFFGKHFIRFNRHLNCIVGKKDSGKTVIFQLMQNAVDDSGANAGGSVKLFIEKAVKSRSKKQIFEYYAYSRDSGSANPELYSIDKEQQNAVKIDASKIDRLKIKPHFYKTGKIEEMISSTKKMDEFLTKLFGKPTRENIDAFNEKFNIPEFLEAKNDQLLYAEKYQEGYRLHANVNWHKKKEKRVEFFRLGKSMRRIVVICMIIVSGKKGPLIIDAPENNFDNEDIVDFLIPVIKKFKDYRQMIVFTSSPILAVNTDPENYILLNSKGKKSERIRKGFSIDKVEKRDILINLMEGSMKSFKRRANSYNSKE